MGIADILDETVELYKSSFVLLVGIAAVMYVPYSLVQRYFMGKFTGLTMQPTLGEPLPMSQLMQLLGVLVLSLLYHFAVTPFVTGATTFAVSERFLGRNVTIAACFKRILNASMIGRLFLAVLFKFLALLVPILLIWLAVFVIAMAAATSHLAMIGVGLVLCVLGLGALVAALYLYMRLMLIETSLVVEGEGFIRALTRTWTLMPGSILKCLIMLFLAGIVTSIVSSITTTPTQLALAATTTKGASPAQWLLVLNAVIGTLGDTIMAPVTSIVPILLYYDIRVRKEGFDLELLANELDAKTRQAAALTTRQLPQEQSPTGPTAEHVPTEGESGSQ